MANYPYLILGRDCSLKCVCVLCGIKAAECKYAGCQNCDKITGHRGCQNERK